MSEKNIKILRPSIERFLDVETFREQPLKDFVSDKDINEVCRYLKNPTSSGIWVLKGLWLETEGITAKILEEVKALEEQTKKSKKRTPEAIEKSVIETAKRMTFVLGSFGYMSYSNEADKKRYVSDVFRDDVLLIEAVEKKFSKECSREIAYFKENILCQALKPRISQREFTYVKDGLILNWLVEPQDKETVRPFKFLSLNPEPLEKIANFFTLIGKVSEYTIQPIYSPEDEVFEPYSDFLRLGSNRIFEEGKIQNLIHQSISTLESGNDAYAISTIGLVFEEQLTQIYETLFRIKCPQGLTLGELLDLINNEVRDRNPAKIKEPLPHAFDFSDIYKRINTAIEGNDLNTLTNKNVLIILRDMLTLVKENNANILSQLKSNSQKNESYSVFPTHITEGMDELIKFRNAISHRSRTPVGKFEATKSIFDLVSLSMWWRDEKKLVNWRKNPDEIIRQMVNRNNPKILTKPNHDLTLDSN